jgi:hypothetical protein
LEKEKPLIFGMIQRSGEVFIRILENVKQRTIKPFVETVIASETKVFTDEYNIYFRLTEWGYNTKQ